MEKPSRKLKKTILILGVTGAVYLSFRFLLPLVIPFLIAYVFALSLRPSALWVERKTRFTYKKKVISIPLALIGGVEILLFMIVLGVILYFGGRKLFMEARLLLKNLPQILDGMNSWMMDNCSFVERFLKLPDGYMVDVVSDIITGGEAAVKSRAMPFLMSNSMTILKRAIQFTVIVVILLIATVLSLQEMDDIRSRRDNSMFCYEYAMLGNRLMTVGSAWLRTQATIMLFTMVICSIGLFLLGNPYFILLGIVIGLLDAMPIFGTGTVLIPWALISLIEKNWLSGIGLIIIYVICYFIREMMEAKIMGGKVGLTPLETLVAMYVGLQLFGILGFILGPIGLLLIEDIVELYEGSCYNSPKKEEGGKA
ncbi:sporulation integral membrane protein YtvI [Clostridium boliviensis]|uniref:Sporulation integral membrane protein YtvI n=1 Tax=Clostridium boliviensis TaxID=318465 RepID=A0ABU4GM43_9CLOT|nr:sporulation integral membrane protein YtvI [Clostridium boliviensis]MDW2798681.1 sporulation integral membrane protein YtvI [Clostridium boliviensis]